MLKSKSQEEIEKYQSLAETEPFKESNPLVKSQNFENVEIRNPNNIETKEPNNIEKIQVRSDSILGKQNFGEIDEDFEIKDPKKIKFKNNVVKKPCPTVSADNMKSKILKSKDGTYYISLKNKNNVFNWFVLK